MATTQEELRNRGIITLCEEIKSESIKPIVEDMMYMNATIEETKLKRIQIILNSVGGGMDPCFMLTDFIEYSKLAVHITGLGICASCGISILMAGAKGKRVITKNTSLLVHQYSWGSRDKYHELVAIRKEQDITHEKMIKHYIKHTKLNRKQIKKILLPPSDVWLTPKEALKYGIVDKIVN